MARGDHQMRIRLPKNVLERITVSAKAAGRSLNAEIVVRLEQSIKVEDDSSTAPQNSQEVQTLRKITDDLRDELSALLDARGRLEDLLREQDSKAKWP